MSNSKSTQQDLMLYKWETKTIPSWIHVIDEYAFPTAVFSSTRILLWNNSRFYEKEKCYWFFSSQWSFLKYFSWENDFTSWFCYCFFFFNLLRWNKTDHSQNGMVLSSFLDWFLKEVVSKKLLIYNTEIDADCRHGGLHQIVTGSLLHWVVCKSTKKFTCKSVDFY